MPRWPGQTYARGTCPVCGDLHALRQTDGGMYAHQSPDGHRLCPGTGSGAVPDIQTAYPPAMVDPGDCEGLSTGGYPCRGRGVLWVPEVPFCKDHAPGWHRELTHARRRRYAELARVAWADVLAELPADVVSRETV